MRGAPVKTGVARGARDPREGEKNSGGERAMAQKPGGDKFVPQNGTRDLNVLGGGSFQLGREMSMPKGPLDGPAKPIPNHSQQGFLGNGQRGPGTAPRQMVPMGEMPNMRLAPRPAPQQLSGAPQLSSGEEVHTVDVIGTGPDGLQYVVSFDAVFPSGTRGLGASIRE